MTLLDKTVTGAPYNIKSYNLSHTWILVVYDLLNGVILNALDYSDDSKEGGMGSCPSPRIWAGPQVAIQIQTGWLFICRSYTVRPTSVMLQHQCINQFQDKYCSIIIHRRLCTGEKSASVIYDCFVL